MRFPFKERRKVSISNKISFRQYKPMQIGSSRSLVLFPQINCGFAMFVGETKTQKLQRIPFSEFFLLLDPLITQEA